jgi:lipopolysaccharide/colanic/teichoic acid biosynthesis glycosyltransferase
MNTIDTEARPQSAPSRHSLEVPRWKRALDITLIILALPVLLPLMICIALVIRFASAGPVLFKQERIGHLGKRFMCFKFRTMAVNNDTSIHQGHLNNLIGSDRPMMKMDLQGDPRIIPFGVPIRSSGLDELPQIINVLRGEMSLVGPRPCVLYEYEKYLPRQKERFNTLPGLTGLWQVSGKNRTTFEQMIQLDIDYGKRKSVWLDCKIIAKTIPALLVQMQETRQRRKLAARPNPSPADIVSESVAAGSNFHRVLQTDTRR